MPIDVRSARSRAVFSGSRVIVAPSSASWLPVRNFVAEWTTTSAPSSSARRKIGVETVASATTSPPWARTASQSGTVSTGFAGDSTQTTSAGGGVPVWSYSTNVDPPAPELAQQHRGAEVRALRERDLRARAARARAARSSRRPCPTSRAARRRPRAPRAEPRPRRRSGGRSARSRTRAARRPGRTARWSSGRRAPPAEVSRIRARSRGGGRGRDAPARAPGLEIQCRQRSDRDRAVLRPARARLMRAAERRPHPPLAHGVRRERDRRAGRDRPRPAEDPGPRADVVEVGLEPCGAALRDRCRRRASASPSFPASRGSPCLRQR